MEVCGSNSSNDDVDMKNNICVRKLRKSLIVAASAKNGIGWKNGLPWRLPQDMEYFKRVTEGSAVIMGRKTWESIPVKFRPLANRMNFVVTSSDKKSLGMRETGECGVGEHEEVATSIDEAIEKCKSNQCLADIFFIGGASIYEEVLSKDLVDRIFLTRIGRSDIDCDVFFPKIDEEKFECVSLSTTKQYKDIPYDFAIFEKRGDDRVTLEGMPHNKSCIDFFSDLVVDNNKDSNESDDKKRIADLPRFRPTLKHEEYQYLDLIREIINIGAKMDDRTGTGTFSVFGRQMRFSLRNDVLPLLTTKRVFWRGVAEELLWFIRGDTNGNLLSEKGVHIWDKNGTREYLDKCNLAHREVGDLGPVYGFQWRHFGAEYKDMHADYSGQGVDQLKRVIDTLRTNPNDRRIILSAWNPADLEKMALPPCHMFCQFYVNDDNELSCLLYQRSADVGLGVPFNIASYALLTRMICHVVGMKPGEFVHVLGNTHVYTNHVEPLREQIQRIPKPFPLLKINREVKDIDDFTVEDFQLIGYNCHPKIQMEMAV